MNQVQRLRMQADQQQIHALLARPRLGAHLTLLEQANALSPQWRFRLRLSRPQPVSLTLVLQLGSQYPFQAPTARLDPAPLHPNVFSSGVICLGNKWLPSDGLDLFITRIGRLLCFDPLLVNLQSPANAAAAQWFRQTLARDPQSLASADLADWQFDQAAPPVRVERACPHCQRRLRLPAGQTGQVCCPRCEQQFFATT